MISESDTIRDHVLEIPSDVGGLIFAMLNSGRLLHIYSGSEIQIDNDFLEVLMYASQSL
ncbi:hypothetical protein PanWU01x14_158800 [Parasponia andersonii]|uniref:Uncharacterized protein n=1 Tax=Parasponia andersonii TaxID=3476 RepID=A0A2P5CEP6_PARAD|nr:hypothetical protein PanWU01x14_158800 [Parasponia andersonii]